MKINEKQIEAVISLPGHQRYEYFIKTVVDWESVWGLYQDGWALASTNDGEQVFPLWPTGEYAALCENEVWSGYAPVSIPLDEMMGELLPSLKSNGVLPGVFYTPTDMGTTPSVKQLTEDLQSELEKYE